MQTWLARDPISRLTRYLRRTGGLDDAALAALDAQAEQLAADLRTRMNVDLPADPAALFADVYAEPTAELVRQRAELLAELEERS